MFRGVTEIKGLAIDIDSFGDESFTEFEKINQEHNCIFLTADDDTYEKLLEIFPRERIIYMEIFQKFLAPNAVTHEEALKALGIKNTELVYVSSNHSFLKNAMGFLSGTIWISDHITYKDAGFFPDLTVPRLSRLKKALEDNHMGFYGEMSIDPLQQGSATMFPVELEYEDRSIPVYTLGRYYGYDHYMNNIHPYSTAIYWNKKEGKPYTGAFNKSFERILSRAIKNLKQAFDVDGICAVPVKPNKADRYKDIIAGLSQEHDIENLGNNFVCTRIYLDQKGLNQEERKQNIKGAFRYDGDLQGKCIILIDDIITTGTTIKECVRVLEEKGAEEVIVLVLAINQFGNYWSSDVPSVSCPICGQNMTLQANKKGGFFYNCNNCYQNRRISSTLKFSVGWEYMYTKENERFSYETSEFAYEDVDWISLKRDICCPHCGEIVEVDLAEECSITASEKQMGAERIYEFDVEDCLCEHCGKAFAINGYVIEYPSGTVTCEEVHVNKR